MKSRKNRDSERKERGRAMSLKKERCVGVCGCGCVCVRACMRACVLSEREAEFKITVLLV